MKIIKVIPMEDDENNEMLSHKIVIDNFMTLEWKIPKVITPLELKAMSSKVNKLFNLSEVQVSDDTTYYSRNHWKPEIKDKLIELFNQGEKAIPISKTLYEMTGDSYFSQTNVVHQQINYLKKIGRLNRRSYNHKNVSPEPIKVPQETKVERNTGRVFTPEIISQMIVLWNEGKKTPIEIRDEFEKDGILFSNKQVGDKLYNLKTKGLIK